MRPARRSRAVTGGRNGYHPDLNRSRRLDRFAPVGRAYGAERHPTRFWLPFAPLPRSRFAGPFRGVSGRPRRHGGIAEQHCDRADGGRLCRRRVGRFGPGTGGHARSQCRHHADRAAIVFRHRPCRAALCAGRRHPVPPQLREPDARSWPRRDRARADAFGLTAASFATDTLRGHAEPAPHYGRDRYPARH